MLVDLPVPDWHSWLAQYRPGIRVVVDWERLVRRPPKVRRVYWPDPLFYPWTTGPGSYWQPDRGGRRRVRWENFRGHSCLVAPAVHWRGTFILLDHCHRIRDHRPEFLAVDALWLNKEQRKYFGDLIFDD